MCGPAPQGGCEEGTGAGYEAVDMDFFARAGCDHVMVDGLTDRATAAKLGAAIANSSNPNMLFGVWSGGGGHSWKWAAEVGGHYWRMGSDSYDSWFSVLRQVRAPGRGPRRPVYILYGKSLMQYAKRRLNNSGIITVGRDLLDPRHRGLH
jgi:hypothetical protein